MNKYKKLADRVNRRWNASKCTLGWANDMIDAITILSLRKQKERLK